MTKKKPSAAELTALYGAVRSYCRRERKDTPVSSPQMVRDWHKICRMVGIQPEKTP